MLFITLFDNIRVDMHILSNININDLPAFSLKLTLEKIVSLTTVRMLFLYLILFYTWVTLIII